MNIGYACLSIGVPGSGIKSSTLKNAEEERLLFLIEHNLNSLERTIDYNIQNGIMLFRISSDLIPFGSSLAAELPWHSIYAEKFAAVGYKILNAGMRVSMHPGQYTVLNSPDKSVAVRAVQDLDYHAKVLNCLGLGSEHKLILHMGGVYGNKNQAADRFISRYKQLKPSVRRRLVLENDDRLFNIGDILETAIPAAIPVVYDTLHNAVNPADKLLGDLDWIKKCCGTWTKDDGPQKIHYSQQHPDKKPGAHSQSIEIDKFLDFYQQLGGTDIDVMMEVKDKNLSALKCLNCVSNRGIGMLEAEWARYKYSILERSPQNYNAVRKLLQNKSGYPALEMYRIIEASLGMPVLTHNAVNAAQHVWGYFKNSSSEAEKGRFMSLLTKLAAGEGGIRPVKNTLLMLARKYGEDYLLNSHYSFI